LAPGQGPVEVVGSRAGERGDDRGRSPRARPRLHQPAQRVDREGEVGGGPGAGRRRGDDDHDLAPHLVAEAARELGQGAAGDLLVELGELAADRGRPVGGERGEGRQRRGQAPRRLEGHDGLPRPEHPLELAGAAGQEALEAPAVGGQPRGHERRDHRRGAGQDLDLEVALDAGADQTVARVRDRGRARIRDQRHARSALDLAGELLGALGLVALVIGDEPGPGQVEAVVEKAGAAGVLAGDQVRLGHGAPGAGAQVVEVSDRRRAHREAPRHQLSPPPGGASVIAITAAPIMPASAPSSAARTGVSFMGASARARSSSRAGPRISSPAAITPPPSTITSGSKMLASDERPAPSLRAAAVTTSRATASPSSAAPVTRAPSNSASRASAWPSAESGAAAAASRPSRAIAVPDASVSRQPRLGQLPWQGGPSMSTTMWPSSAAAPVAPLYGRPPRMRPPPMPVPIVSITT